MLELKQPRCAPLGSEQQPASVLGFFDRFLYRHPFEGRSANRYRWAERPAFEALDDRLLDALDLARVRTLLDVGCGPGTFARRARVRCPHLVIVELEPSRTLARPGMIRARGEQLPLAPSSIDLAICLSSIRHVRDRASTLRELRRVVRGTLVIVELDPAADRHRIAAHADRLGSSVLRLAFGPLVVRTAPPAELILQLAVAAGFSRRALRPDPIQPVYIMELE
ncbi:MAG: class I SAM-dependent methyltransferase [Kofleriaceae bacterium]